MPEINFAEQEARLRDSPTLDECRRMAQVHAGYGWSQRPWGHWSEAQKAAYDEGFRSYREEG